MRLLLAASVVLLVACSDGTDSPVDPVEQGGAGGTTPETGGGGAGAGNGGSGGDPTTSAGGQGGAGGSGGMSPCGQLSDELDDTSTLSCWSLLHQVDGDAARHDSLELGVAGNLEIEPHAGGWFQNDRGPFMFKEITGNFVIEIHAAALDETNDTIPPTGDFHSAGLIARDPSSANGDENWIMYNVGHQNAQGATTGTEGKTTDDSVSILTINQGDYSGLLRLCRVGDDFRLIKQLDDESVWTEEHQYTRSDLPATLQVGMIANAWPPGATTEARNMQGRFAHFHVGVPASIADCTATIDQQ